MTNMSWLNEPPEWSVDGDSIQAVSGSSTDFWCETFYGFTRDSGHFYHRDVTGDFTAEVTLSGDYRELYDQSGLMVRADASTWLKTGIEYTDGRTHVSTVLTRDFSDWSVVAWPDYAGSLRIRLTRHGDALRVQCRARDGQWQLLRLGYLALPPTVQVGVMLCSPERAGFAASFTDFVVSDPISRDLH